MKEPPKMKVSGKHSPPINGLMAEVIEGHIQTHIANPAIASEAERSEGADELIDVIHAYLK